MPEGRDNDNGTQGCQNIDCNENNLGVFGPGLLGRMCNPLDKDGACNSVSDGNEIDGRILWRHPWSRFQSLEKGNQQRNAGQCKEEEDSDGDGQAGGFHVICVVFRLCLHGREHTPPMGPRQGGCKFGHETAASRQTEAAIAGNMMHGVIGWIRKRARGPNPTVRDQSRDQSSKLLNSYTNLAVLKAPTVHNPKVNDAGRFVRGNAAARTDGLRSQGRRELQLRSRRTSLRLTGFVRLRAAEGRPLRPTQLPIARRYAELTVLADDWYRKAVLEPDEPAHLERYLAVVGKLLTAGDKS
jgi:hypothetical protein